MAELNTLDELTSISNYDGFLLLAEQGIKLCARHNSPVTVVIFDLDDFSEINERLGQDEGDNALRAFASIMKKQFRVSDVYARVEADEFVILLNDTGTEYVEAVLNRFQDAVTAYNQDSESDFDLYYTSGFAVKNSEDDLTINDLIKEARALLYEKQQQKEII